MLWAPAKAMTSLSDCVSDAIATLARCRIAAVRALITSRRQQPRGREHCWSEYFSRMDIMKIKRSNELSLTMRAKLGYACNSAGTFPRTFPFSGDNLASFDSFSLFG